MALVLTPDTLEKSTPEQLKAQREGTIGTNLWPKAFIKSKAEPSLPSLGLASNPQAKITLLVLKVFGWF